MGSATLPAMSPLRYTALSMSFGAVTIAAVTLAATAFGVASPAWPQVASLWPEIAYLSLIAGVSAVLAWNAGIGTLGPATGSLFVNLVPVTAFAIAIAQGRRFDAIEIAGALLTIAALIGGNLASRAPAVPASAGSAPSLRASPGLRASPR